MNKTKLILAMLAVMAVTPTFGSFDLILAASYSDGKVYRFDGATGAALGSFGPGNGVAWSVVADQPRQLAYVTSGSKILKYNYNTGEFKGYLDRSVGTDRWCAINSAGSEFYIPTGSNIEVLNPNTGATIRNLTRNGFAARTVSSIAPQIVMAIGTLSTSVAAITFNTATGAVIQEALLGTGNFSTQSSLIGGQNAVVAYISDGDGISEMARVGFNASGAITGTNVSVVDPYYTNLSESGWGIAPSHTGFWTTGSYDQVTFSKAELRRYLSTSTGYYLETKFRPTERTYTSLATVLAPEPGTMLMIGAGVVALLRQRNRR